MNSKYKLKFKQIDKTGKQLQRLCLLQRQQVKSAAWAKWASPGQVSTLVSEALADAT